MLKRVPRPVAGASFWVAVVALMLGPVVAAIVISRGGGGGAGMKVAGDPAIGEALFKGYCSSCHTLKAARATARFGPNLDIVKPSYAQVIHQVETGGTGGAGLPPAARLTFGPGIHTFTRSDIRDIAAFVFLSTHS
jgi:mono/diheme cytochrome c family protein